MAKGYNLQTTEITSRRETQERILLLYLEGATQKQIAEAVGVKSQQLVSWWLRRLTADYETRQPGAYVSQRAAQRALKALRENRLRAPQHGRPRKTERVA